ncbi:Uncharacterized protein TCM_017301 [Theobroma cacao]|uniref:Uncharacterized protein n=1 Tax=Theobroma cacao TaxID=3641 RepID=A0A061EKS2_THECC|nr:Uncharacterized protein TCM_017301 [Theobroma cacao]
MIQALMEEHGEDGFMYNVEYDQDGHLTHLFLAHPTSIALTKSYLNIFITDCTYKTNRYSQIPNYIKNTWLPYKEKFITAWIKKYTHFGNRVTSSAKGAHANLKKYRQVSISDLHIVKDKICQAIENQFQEIKAKLSSERIRVPHEFLIPSFKNVVTCVSICALEELSKQYKLAYSDSLLLWVLLKWSSQLKLIIKKKTSTLFG